MYPICKRARARGAWGENSTRREKARIKMKAWMSVAGAAIAAAPALATVYTDSASFLANVQPGVYFEDFAGVPAGEAPSLSFSDGTFSYDITAGFGGGTGTLFNDPGLISTNSAVDFLQIDFTSGNVTAVGGNMYATDIFFFPVVADMVITLSDGTVESFTSSSATDFRGFTSGVVITSLTIEAVDGLAPAWATLQNFYVGAAVPAPGALALLGLGGIAAGRRRR